MEAEWTWKSNCFFYIAAVINGLGAIVIGREDKALWHIGQLYMLGVAAFLLLLRGEDMFHGAENQICGKFGYAMLPASKREKFWSMIFYCMLVCPAMVFVGGMLFDCLLSALPFGPYKQWLFETSLLFDGKNMWQVMSNTFMELGMPVAYGVFVVLVSYMFRSSVFFFTATLFRKHKVLLTLISLWLLNFVLTMFTMPIFTNFIENHPDFFDHFSNGQVVHGLLWGYMIFIAAVSLLLLWWSGRRLRNMKY